MKRMFVTAAVSVSLLLGACAAPQRLNTASGGPEVRIAGVQKKAVADRLVAAFVAHGFQVRAVNEYAVELGKQMDSPVLSGLYGSQFNGTPELRRTFNMVDVGAGVVLLTAKIEMVTNPGSGFEKRENVTYMMAKDMQQDLEQFAREMRP